jgi:hypothetical protein
LDTNAFLARRREGVVRVGARPRYARETGDAVDTGSTRLTAATERWPRPRVGNGHVVRGATDVVDTREPDIAVRPSTAGLSALTARGRRRRSPVCAGVHGLGGLNALIIDAGEPASAVGASRARLPLFPGRRVLRLGIGARAHHQPHETRQNHYKTRNTTHESLHKGRATGLCLAPAVHSLRTSFVKSLGQMRRDGQTRLARPPSLR